MSTPEFEETEHTTLARGPEVETKTNCSDEELNREFEETEFTTSARFGKYKNSVVAQNHVNTVVDQGPAKNMVAQTMSRSRLPRTVSSRW